MVVKVLKVVKEQLNKRPQNFESGTGEPSLKKLLLYGGMWYKYT